MAAPNLQILLVDSAEVVGLYIPDTYLIGVCPVQPHSRGTVRLAGRDPELAPIVDPNYLSDERDMERQRGESIRSTLPVPQITVPRIRQWDGDLDLLDQVGRWMELPAAS